MALIGLGTATLAALILGVRSRQAVNKLFVAFVWTVFAAWSFGVRV